jgi:hypothetical protein
MIAGDSKIFLLSDLGEPTTIGALASLRSFPYAVFTATGRVTVGTLDRIVNMGKRKIISVTLDDNSVLRVTADQKLLLLDGTYAPASDCAGKSLTPLYLGEKKGYPTFEEIGDYHLHALTSMDCERVRKVARMVGEYKRGDRLPPKTTVSHIDGNKKNCHPDNLDVSVNLDAKQRKFMHPYAKAIKEANEFIKANKRNHKVIAVEDAGEDFVYGCVSLNSKNLAVNGVFIGTIEDE